MAVLVDASTEGLRRTSDFPSTTYTMAGWLYISAIGQTDWDTVCNYMEDSSVYHILYCRDNTTWRFQIYNSANNATILTPSLNTWYFCGMRNSGTTLVGFAAAIGATSLTTATPSGSAAPSPVAEMSLGRNQAWTEWTNGRFFNWMVWDGVALTNEQLLMQMNSTQPVVGLEYLHLWTPLLGAGDLVDYSGNGRNWTSAGGTLTTEDGPPVSWGAPVLPALLGVTGVDTSDSQPAYARGSASAASSKPAYVAGSLAASSSKAAYAEGVTAGGTVSDRVAAYVEGVGLALVPDGDVSYSGAWKNELGTQVNLYESINEYPDPSDSDYVWYDDAHLNEYFEVTLSDPGGVPGTGDVKIHWRIADFQSTGNVQLTVQLREGAAVIASTSQTAPSSGTTYTYTLSSGEKASITDWSNLRLRFIISQIT